MFECRSFAWLFGMRHLSSKITDSSSIPTYCSPFYVSTGRIKSVFRIYVLLQLNHALRRCFTIPNVIYAQIKIACRWLKCDPANIKLEINKFLLILTTRKSFLYTRHTMGLSCDAYLLSVKVFFSELYTRERNRELISCRDMRAIWITFSLRSTLWQ